MTTTKEKEHHMQHLLAPKSKWRTLRGCLKIQSRYVFHVASDPNPTSWPNIEHTMFPLERNLCGHPFVGHLFARKTICRGSTGSWMGKRNELGRFASETRIVLVSVCVDDFEMGKVKMVHMWKKLMEHVPDLLCPVQFWPIRLCTLANCISATVSLWTGLFFKSVFLPTPSASASLGAVGP